jgi:hypothetical protein
MQIKKERVAVKKRRDDFMLLSLDRIDRWNVSPGAGGAQLLQGHDPQQDHR